jgi:hypothetical protein
MSNMFLLRQIGRTFHCGVLANVGEIAAAIALLTAFGTTPALASPISGTLSNFDTYYDNTATPSIDAYGAEIELEDIHSSDVQTTYPSNYNSSLTTDISDLGNGHFGTRIRFDGYNFPGTSGFIAPNPNPPSTNGHACVGTAGCEHFGFSASVQPTAMRFFWLDQSGSRIGSTPLTIPNPTWTYVPPAAGVPARIQAAVVVPEPVEVEAQLPDSLWMRIFVTETEVEVELDDLVSDGVLVPHEETETEIEWEFLAGGEMFELEADVPEAGKSIVRRYEYFKYTGPYSDEHEPTAPKWDGVGDFPPTAGAFIAANMVAVNFAIPEPSTVLLALTSICLWCFRRTQRAELR